MRVIIDTHVLVWSLHEKQRLGQDALALLRDPTTDILVSAATLWEVSIKRATGKLITPDHFLDIVRAAGHTILPINEVHAWRAGALPPHHRDPFDRLLVAQAQIEAVPLVTHDRQLAAYDLRLIWA